MYKLPAEWNKHLGTILSYPIEETFFDRTERAKGSFLQYVKYISEGEKVFINFKSEDDLIDFQKRLAKLKNINTSNIQTFINQYDDVWCRDNCPIFVKDKNNNTIAIKFRFNAWGEKYPYKKDDELGKKLPELLGIPKIEVDMILEGGAIDIDDLGHLITTESCLLNPNRNPNLTKEEIENNLKKYLGAKKIYWLKEGIVGDDTDGHIDDITRFVANKTIITAVEKDPNDENYQILQENLKLLQSFKTIDEDNFKIIQLPMPEPIYYKYPNETEETRLPASYINFYITNKYVIVPIFNSKRDKEALEIIQQNFPNKKVIGIYAGDIIVGLGAFHCLSQQIPE